MPEPRLDASAYALLEFSFQNAPILRSHNPHPRPRDESRSFSPAAEPLKETVLPDDDTDSHLSSQQPTPLASPGAVNGADSGLPPTPPSNSQDDIPASTSPPQSHADGVAASLMARKPSASTPVNQRSPPTPDPSPPRTTESMAVPERPVLFAYPSSRAESFETAREDPFSSDGGDSRTSTPLGNRLSTVEEDRSLGLAFERDDNDITPTNGPVTADAADATRAEDKGPLSMVDVPEEWDTNLMRNVTVRKRRNSKPSPLKAADSNIAPSMTGSPRRSSSLRERVNASNQNSQTKSIEHFAQSIGWPTEAQDMPDGQQYNADSKRLSTSSMSSTVVEAMVIVTPPPPHRRRTLRHSGKNLAYSRDSDSPSPSRASYSKRSSMQSDDIPLHKLLHKRAVINGQAKRASIGSESSGHDRYSSPLSMRKRGEEIAAITLSHQESVRRILQPAAEIMSRSNSLHRPLMPERTLHKRMSSAPEPSGRREALSLGPSMLAPSPPISPRRLATGSPGRTVRTPQSARNARFVQEAPRSPTRRSIIFASEMPNSPSITGRSVSNPSVQSANESHRQSEQVVSENQADQRRPPSALIERVRILLSEREGLPAGKADPQEAYEPTRPRANSVDTAPTIRRLSVSTRGQSEERRRSSLSQDRNSTSRDTLPRPSLDRVPTDEIPRQSHEWHGLHPEENHRVSFDRSTVRTEEHAMARHLFAQTTPFSQFSDTPIEVSEATAVSIYPHNNHSLLVVQQVSRSSTYTPEQRLVASEAHLTPESQPSEAPPTPPFVDASEGPFEPKEQGQQQQPTLTFEPSTPPMQILLPVPNAVDSPLKNPRKPPEPPSFKIIPPTPADELERQLPPGPPKRSDSHPQRRLSLVQRARRYSDNIISPLLARASSTQKRHASDSHATREGPRIPTVNDEDGSLHPFWRPRGFWDGFDDSDSESEEDTLPQGGDTSDIQLEPETPRKIGNLSRRLTSIKGSGGFLNGNSLGIDRHGTNRRRPHINLPSRRTWSSPKILIQPPTLPLRSRSPRIEKRGSRTSLKSSSSLERRRGGKRDAWRRGRPIPGLKGVQVQYIGLSGVKERFKEKKAEKRRDNIRKSIGSRYYVESGSNAI